ncbi:MAG: hypothetical protein HQK62_09995 [Desulfamplus sp.]|nr:hypothetical protein [Desulfamplus sp.]
MARILTDQSQAKLNNARHVSPWTKQTLKRHKEALRQALFIELIERAFWRAERKVVIRVTMYIILSNNTKLKSLLLAGRVRRWQVAGKGRFIDEK